MKAKFFAKKAVLSWVRVPAVLLVWLAGAAYADSGSPPYEILPGVSITEEACDTSSEAFGKVDAADRFGIMSFDKCVDIHHLDWSSDPYWTTPEVAKDRFVVAPRGNVAFVFYVQFRDHATQLHAHYKITVTAKGMLPGETATGIGEVTLWGSQAPDVPASAKNTYLQATTTRPAAAEVVIPVNVDWAESRVSFKVESSQGVGSDDPIVESCTTPAAKRAGLICTHPDWTNAGIYAGPDLSGVNAGITLPAAITKDEFVLFVQPAGKLQLPILPVAIVYAPLGNGTKAQSSYQVATVTGSTLKFGTTNTAGWTSSSDDKTTYSGDAGVSYNDAKLGVKFSSSPTWAKTSTSGETSTGKTGSIMTSDQIGYVVAIPATTTLPLSQVTYETQPFWSDLFIATINAQSAVWDYPGGPVIEPLGNSAMIQIPVKWLVQAAKTPTSLPTSSGACGTDASYLADPHVLRYMSGSGVECLYLSPQDAKNILALDIFYAKKTQSAAPSAFRRLSYGNFYDQLTVNSTQQTQLSAGEKTTNKYTTSVTSSESNMIGGNLSFSKVLDYLGFTLNATSESTTSLAKSATVSYESETTQTLQLQTQASTTIHDNPPPTKPVPVGVYQDLLFQGLAVQVPDMNFPVPPDADDSGPQQPPGASASSSQCGTFVEEKITLRKPGGPVVPIHRVRTIPCILDSKLPILVWNDNRPPKNPPNEYVVRSAYGDWTVSRKIEKGQVIVQVQGDRAKAAKRHFARPIPAAAKATVRAPRIQKADTMVSPGSGTQEIKRGQALNVDK
jgi:hypothetical protein